MNYRHSIISIPKNCITIDSTNLYFTINKGQRLTVAFADGSSDYLFDQFYTSKQFKLSSGNSLYFDITLDTGHCELVFGNSNFTYGFELPTDPTNNDCFFDLNTNKMYYWNNSNWAPCIRLFLCKILNNTINSFPINRSHVGLNEKCNAVKLNQTSWKKIKNNNVFEISTVVDAANQTEYISFNKLNTSPPTCGESIPKYKCIGIASDGKYYKCTAVNKLTCVAITTHDSLINTVPKIIHYGVLESHGMPLLNAFSQPNTKLYMGVDGSLTATVSDSDITQEVGRLVNQFCMVVNIFKSVTNINYV